MYQILVIDDRIDRLDWFSKTLEAFGYDVRLAPDAESALDQFRETEFDLAFFDHDLGPGLDGSRLAYQVLNSPRRFKWPKAAWVHTSNTVGAENIAAKFRSADVPYHVEPFEVLIKYPEDFRNTVARLLEGAA